VGDAITDQVRQQYSAFRYPAPIMDIPAALESGYFLYSDPAKFSALIWPEGRPSDALRILVAGCGTNEAAIIAHTIRRVRSWGSTCRERASTMRTISSDDMD
jgi:hypothetical protein